VTYVLFSRMTSRVERMLKLTGQAAALAVVAAMLGVLVWRLTHQSHQPKTGTAAPPFSAALLLGPGELKLASLRGKAVVINFFQSSCVPGKAESKALEMAYQQYRHNGVVEAPPVVGSRHCSDADSGGGGLSLEGLSSSRSNDRFVWCDRW
jgi:AhpC/TSA family